MRQFAFYFYEHNNAGLLFLLVVVVVDAFHKDFAVGDTSPRVRRMVVG